MNRLIALTSLLSFVALAQSTPLEEPNTAATGLRPSAGGSSIMGDGVTRITNVSALYEEVDLALKTGLGTFVIKRKFTTDDSWFRVGGTNSYAHHGEPADYNNEMQWFSTLSAYATYTRAFGGTIRGVPVTDTQEYIQVRDTDGDLTESFDFAPYASDKWIPVKSGPNRLKWLGNRTVGQLTVPDSILLVQPGGARLEFEFRSDTSTPYAYKSTYRLSKIYADTWTSTPICSFVYPSATSAKVQQINCFGGTSIAAT